MNGNIFHPHGLEESILLKCSYYSKQSTDFINSIKISMAFSQKQNNPKMCMELKKKTSKAILRNKNKAASSYALISNFITKRYQLKQYDQLSLVAQRVKNPPATQETWVQSLGWEDPLEEGMATHSSIPAWRIPWTEEPGRLQSMGSQRVGCN